MRFSTTPHPCSGGLDLHARTLDRCGLHQEGAILLHRHMQAGPAPFLQALAPSRADLVVGVACLVTWYGRAERCTREGMPVVWGHAFSMHASHGGTAKHAKIDAQQLAGWRRGGMLPPASVYPAAMRATSDLLRRRLPLTRTRAAWWAPSQQTTSPDHLPALGTQLASTAHRDGVADRVAEPAVPQRIAVARAVSGHDAGLRTALARARVPTAKAPEAQTCSRWRSSPGVGTSLARVRLYAIPDRRRVPRVPACVSSGRRVQWAKASAGNRSGTSGQTRGHAALQWAVADAAVLCLRHNPAGQQSRTRVTQQHGQGNAWTSLAHQWARAV